MIELKDLSNPEYVAGLKDGLVLMIIIILFIAVIALITVLITHYR